jgi:MoxR-like ATPase
VYLFAPDVTLAINVALAAGRPLLVTGEPGSGKTRLAAAVAEAKRWEFYPRTITSRTQAAELLWTFDALRRLNDATTPSQTPAQVSPQRYVEPSVVWWGFDPLSARQRGLAPLDAPSDEAAPPKQARRGDGAVILIDEIDKADPDVPNDLLEPFDVRRFTVKETNDLIEARRDTFLVLTTNGERELPPAFLRRCVVLTLAEPDEQWFTHVARQHFPNGDRDVEARVAREVQRLRGLAKPGARKPSTAEFLDAVRVCNRLRLDPAVADWQDVVNAVLLKTGEVAPSRARRAADAVTGAAHG